MEPKKPFHEIVAEKLIEQLKQGTAPWQKPWQPGEAGGIVPMNPTTENRYKGINAMWLMAQGYSDQRWMTYKQAQALGGQVTKGQEVEEKVRFLKTYTVFNADQIEGLPESFYAPVYEALDPEGRIAHCESFFSNTGATIHQGGGRAYFSPSEDYIQMPNFASFRSPEAYYSILGHETIHRTGHASRLDRNLTSFRAYPELYAFEELVAELLASFLSSRLQLEPEPREDHASYIAHWLKILKDNDRAVFRAASLAQKAVEYVVGLQAAEVA